MLLPPVAGRGVREGGEGARQRGPLLHAAPRPEAHGLPPPAGAVPGQGSRPPRRLSHPGTRIKRPQVLQHSPAQGELILI